MSKTLRGLSVVLVVALAILPFAWLAPVHGSPLRLEAAPSASGPVGLPEVLAALLVVGMAIKVKDAATTGRKWVARAQQASGDYKAGVAQAGGDWEAAALASKDNYAAGVQQAIGDGRFEKGIRESGGAHFQQRASELGATRFAPGVAASEGQFVKGVAPVLQAIAAMTLPPRAPKGDPRNMERANFVASALRKLKTGR